MNRGEWGNEIEHRPAGFEVVSVTEAELKVTESARRGTPMTLIRGGGERDVAAIMAAADPDYRPLA